MIVQYGDLVMAINRVNGWRNGIEMGGFERQLAAALEEYKAAGEFDGSVDSARKCLHLDGYDLAPECFGWKEDA